MAGLRRGDHVFIPFDADGKPFMCSGKIRVFRSIDKAAKVGFFDDSLVEYAPVRRAKWIVDHDSGSIVLSCSDCGEQYWIEREDDKHPDWCPGCGALMEGGDPT